MSYPGNNLHLNIGRLVALQTFVNSKWFWWIAKGPIPVASPGLETERKKKKKKIGMNAEVETALILERGAW